MSPEHTALAVTVDALEARYGANTVLKGVHLDVAPGEIVALLGPSGCGKTTLLRSIAGLETPSAGTVSIGGQPMNGPRPVAPQHRRVGMVFQDGALFPHLKVIDNVGYGLARADRRSDHVRGLLELVGLGDKAERYPGTLSGGEQQRVALARALAPNPAVMLLDEPFSSLDAALRVQLRVDVRELLKRVGVTSVLVTHDQQEALMFGDRVAVMRAGVIEQLSTPAEVYRRPRTEWVARFVGDANLVHGDADGPCVVTALGELPTVAPHHGPVTVLLRPEDLVLEPGLGDEVIASNYVGQETAYEVRLASGEKVTTRAYGVPQLETGSTVAVRYRGDAVTTWPRHVRVETPN